MVEESNKELEDWANEFCVDFERYIEEENRRMEEQDIVLGIIFDNEENDMLLDYYKASGSHGDRYVGSLFVANQWYLSL